MMSDNYTTNFNYTTNDNLSKTDMDTFDINDSSATLVALIISMILMYINGVIGLIGDATVFSLFYFRRRLRKTPVNLLVLNLCIADLFNVLITTPLLLGLLTKRVYHGKVSNSILHCRFHDFVFFTAGCTEIITFICIASERVNSLKQLFGGEEQARRVHVFIGVSWIFGICNGVMSIFFTGPFEKEFCDDAPVKHFGSSYTYGTYVFTPMVTCTGIVIIIFYIKIMILIRARKRIKDSLKVNNKISPSVTSSKLKTTSIEVSDTTLLKKYSKPSTQDIFTVTPQSINICNMDGTIQEGTADDVTVGSICMFNAQNKEAGKRRLELIAAKKTAVVIAMFLLCWIPLPLIILSQFYMTSHQKSVGALYTLAIVMVLSGSSINSLVYAFCNKQFKSEFKHLYIKYRKWLKQRNLL